MCLHVSRSPQKTEEGIGGSEKGKIGASGNISGLKQEETINLLVTRKPEGLAPGRPRAMGHTNLMRQLCEFRSRWMMHMECK